MLPLFHVYSRDSFRFRKKVSFPYFSFCLIVLFVFAIIQTCFLGYEDCWLLYAQQLHYL